MQYTWVAIRKSIYQSFSDGFLWGYLKTQNYLPTAVIDDWSTLFRKSEIWAYYILKLIIY